MTKETKWLISYSTTEETIQMHTFNRSIIQKVLRGYTHTLLIFQAQAFRNEELRIANAANVEFDNTGEYIYYTVADELQYPPIRRLS